MLADVFDGREGRRHAAVQVFAEEIPAGPQVMRAGTASSVGNNLRAGRASYFSGQLSRDATDGLVVALPDCILC